MNIKDFAESYDLHDSYIEAVNYDKNNRTVTLNINFAFWRQRHYVEGSPETGILYATFHNVSRYCCKNGDPTGEFTGILKAEYNNGSLVLKLSNDKTLDYFEMLIKADEVTIKT